jgi:hypothetical protein
MASGILLAYGQNFVIDRLSDYLNASGAYVGLMTNSTQPAEAAQLPTISGITEITGSGYTRQLCAVWTKFNDGGVDPYTQGATVTLEASGTWANVNGYFVSKSLSGNDALWAEPFSSEKQGTKYAGDKLLITPKYEQKYENEA